GGAARREGAAEPRRGLRPRRVGADGLLHVHRPCLHAADARLLFSRTALGGRRADRDYGVAWTACWPSSWRRGAPRAARRSTNRRAAPSARPAGPPSSP